jgi:hypothetical protein
MEGEPERSESSREQSAPTRTNPSGGTKGHGFLGGSKPLERRGKAVRVLSESAGTERGTREGFSITREEESSEERSPGALRAERGPQGCESHTISSRG